MVNSDNNQSDGMAYAGFENAPPPDDGPQRSLSRLGLTGILMLSGVALLSVVLLAAAWRLLSPVSPPEDVARTYVEDRHRSIIAGLLDVVLPGHPELEGLSQRVSGAFADEGVPYRCREQGSSDPVQANIACAIAINVSEPDTLSISAVFEIAVDRDRQAFLPQPSVTDARLLRSETIVNDVPLDGWNPQDWAPESW